MDKAVNHKAKPVWNLLLVKAQNQVRQAQIVLSNVYHQRQQALQRSEQIDQLLIEYRQYLYDLQQRSQNAAEANNYRQFIVHLQTIRSRAKSVIESLEQDCKQARERLQAVDSERLKVESLAQRDAEQQRKTIASQQSKLLEAENILRHNNSQTRKS